MHLSLDVLSRFTDLPDDPAATRVLMDEVGLEVKRIDPSAPGVPLSLELLANRGDHHCYVGIARELCGRTGGPLRQPEGLALVAGEAPHPLMLQTDLCPVYTLTELHRTGEGSLPAEALALLESCQIHSIGPVVDATNVVNLELGQPTHAFDADTIEGSVTIRLSRPGEQAWPLFQDDKVVLPEGTVVIADDAKVLAIAGVIGCEESKTTEATTRVLLESAAFDPVAVRKAHRALGISTDSSARFERGSDFSMPLVGAGRVAHLLAAAGWQVHGTSGVVGTWSDPRRTLTFEPEACRRFLGVDTSDAELAQRLERYGFTLGAAADIDPVSGTSTRPDSFRVMVPPHRLWDVEFAADLYEEIAKSLGYDNTPISLPPVDMGSLPTPWEQTRTTVEDVLIGQGFFEVITDGFHSRGLLDKLGISEGHALHAHVETANALDRAYSLLKNQCLGQALDGLVLNLAHRLSEVKAFEVTRTFHPDAAAPNGVCTERPVLWALANGHERGPTWSGAERPSDALFLKGVLAELFHALGVPVTLGPASQAPALGSCLHPTRQAALLLDGEPVGVMGEVHPAVLAAFKIKRHRPVFVELSLAPLVRPPERIVFEEPPRTHPVERSLAFTLPLGVEAGAVATLLAEAGPSWLDDVRITDRYDHEIDGAPVRTITFALVYSLELGDRSADEMNAATEALIASVEVGFGGRGVTLRG